MTNDLSIFKILREGFHRSQQYIQLIQLIHTLANLKQLITFIARYLL